MTSFTNKLDRLQEFITEMEGTSSNKVKLEILKKYSDDYFIVKVLKYTYNWYKKYGVHVRVLKKHSNLQKDGYIDLFYLLDALEKRTITGHTAIAYVNGFINNLPSKYEDLIHRIIDRDLKIRANGRSINKVIPGCIPTFKVALANNYSPKRVDLENEEWFGSRKLDGIRCLIRKEGKEVTAFSRNGKEIETLGKILEEVKGLSGNFVLDGEICLVDENGKEDFQGIMKQIRRKEHTIENPKYLVFDCLTLNEFDEAKGNDNPLSNRLNFARKIIGTKQYIEVIDQEIVKTEDRFAEMVKDAEDQGFEGIMVRKNSDYEGKRGWNLLKVKKFHDEEYTVKDIQMGPMRWIENGSEVEKEVLRNIIIEHKGCLVSVGSGFSKEEREHYHSNPKDILGKTVTVQYFEETQNQSGGFSLRFPVIKFVYENGRTV
jgi:DNA ligase-1